MIAPSLHDLAFSALYLFGLIMCAFGVWWAMSDRQPYSARSALCVLFGGFMLFPLLNTILGVALIIHLSIAKMRCKP